MDALTAASFGHADQVLTRVGCVKTSVLVSEVDEA
jgi:hypothetical protein